VRKNGRAGRPASCSVVESPGWPKKNLGGGKSKETSTRYVKQKKDGRLKQMFGVKVCVPIYRVE